MVHFSAMGYVPQQGFEEEVKLVMYDGAGTRAKLGNNIKVVTPPNKFKDGVTMKVGLVRFFLPLLTQIPERVW